jgi:hypothetical protein
MVCLSRDERRAMAVRALRDHPDWSDRRLAEHTGLDRATLSRHRMALAWNDEIPVVPETVGINGKTYRGPRGHRRRYTLTRRIAALRQLIRGLDDPAWKAGSSRDRRLAWLLAERLVEEIGASIDVVTGDLM